MLKKVHEDTPHTNGHQSVEPPPLNIVGEQVALGPLRRDLLPLYQQWFNNSNCCAPLTASSNPSHSTRWSAGSKTALRRRRSGRS